GHLGMRYERRLHFRGAKPVARDVDDIIDAARDPVVSVLVTATAVAREVHALVGREIGLHEALVIAEHGAHLAGPAVEDHEVTARCAFEHVSLLVHEAWFDAKERPCRRAWLQFGGTRQRRDEDAAGLRLPPGVHNRAASIAHHTMIPLPSLR